MLRVEIKAPSYSPHGVEPWIDHAGNEIWNLTFSKEYLAAHVPGHYPLESLGSIYRNIDNFRESPLQSRLDWEIRIPLLYSSPDGSFSTVDLLYWLESVNEQAGLEFDLIGCEAFLYDGDTVIYFGVVESIQSGGMTASLRISDWLGNPKIGKSDFPVSIGIADVSKWQPAITKDRNCLNIEISSRPLRSKPDFYLKIGDAFARIEEFKPKGREEPCSMDYSAGYKNATIKFQGDTVLLLPEDIGLEDLMLPDHKPALAALRPNIRKDTPDYYSIGEGNDFEILEAWSGNLWSSTALEQIGEVPDVDGYSIGRPEFPARRPHAKGDAIRRLEEFEIDAIISVSFPAESIVNDFSNGVYYPPYSSGNPSQLAFNSRVYRTGGLQDEEIDFKPCPKFLLVCKNDFIPPDPYDPYLWDPVPSVSLRVNMSDAGIADSAEIIDGKVTVFIALKAYPSPGFYYKLNDKKIATDGRVISYTASGLKTVAKVRHLEMSISMGHSNPKAATFEEFQKINPIQVGFVRLECSVRVPLEGNKLYVSGELDASRSPMDIPEAGTVVKTAVQNLLDLAGAEGIASGAKYGLRYGNIINREAFALRDKLRSLAAESATLIKFSPNAKAIIASDISLQDGIVPAFIPMDAFLHENNAYYFKMESSDRSDLLSGVAIHWGKNIETGEYAHTFSVAAGTGIERDGEKAGPRFIESEKWQAVFSRMGQNLHNCNGTNKIVDSEWITNWDAAENMAYNLLRWNTAPMRKANARLIYTVLEGIGDIDIGALVSFDLPGYPKKFSETSWVVTGRHDDLDSMIATLELLEARGLPAVPPNRYLLLEDTRNLLLENSKKIKLEDMYG